MEVEKRPQTPGLLSPDTEIASMKTGKEGGIKRAQKKKRRRYGENAISTSNPDTGSVVRGKNPLNDRDHFGEREGSCAFVNEPSFSKTIQEVRIRQIEGTRSGKKPVRRMICAEILTRSRGLGQKVQEKIRAAELGMRAQGDAKSSREGWNSKGGEKEHKKTSQGVGFGLAWGVKPTLSKSYGQQPGE